MSEPGVIDRYLRVVERSFERNRRKCTIECPECRLECPFAAPQRADLPEGPEGCPPASEPQGGAPVLGVGGFKAKAGQVVDVDPAKSPSLDNEDKIPPAAA